jgi:hypothetical protein
MAAPIRERLPLPVGDGRDILGRKGAEQDEDQVTVADAMLSAKLRQAECGLISGAAAMPAGSADLSVQELRAAAELAQGKQGVIADHAAGAGPQRGQPGDQPGWRMAG